MSTILKDLVAQPGAKTVTRQKLNIPAVSRQYHKVVSPSSISNIEDFIRVIRCGFVISRNYETVFAVMRAQNHNRLPQCRLFFLRKSAVLITHIYRIFM